MTTSPDPLYAGYRYPAELIGYAVWLYFRFPLSLRMVEEMLAARGISVTYETIRHLDRGHRRGDGCIITPADGRHSNRGAFRYSIAAKLTVPCCGVSGRGCPGVICRPSSAIGTACSRGSAAGRGRWFLSASSRPYPENPT